MNSISSKNVSEIINYVNTLYPNAECTLHFETPLQLLIATILSAQCTDERVNLLTVSLFKKYQTAKDYFDANLQDLEKDIKSTGFYRNKAKNIKNACRMIIEKYNNKVPNQMEELTSLPGVARKTANVVLGSAFGISEGIAVDTHVHRLSNRLGLSDKKQAEKVEQDLMKIVPQKSWTLFSHQLILHGRYVCKAQKPLCLDCNLKDLCPKIGVPA